MVGRVLAIVAAGLAAVPAGASAATRVATIPGITGSTVRAVDAERLDDGGAVVALTIPRRGGGRQAAVIRLRHDGTLLRAFGRRGVVRLGGRGSRATAISASLPGGRIAVAVREVDGSLELRSLDERGRARRRFGAEGVVVLPGGFRDGATSLDQAGDRLVVSGGSLPCSGCWLATLGTDRGQPIAESTLTPVQDPAARCPDAVVTSLEMPDRDRVLVAGWGQGRPGCEPAVHVRTSGTLEHVAVSPAHGQVRIGAGFAGRGICAALSAETFALARLEPGGPFEGIGEAGVPGAAAAVVPLAGGGCSALTARRIVQAFPPRAAKVTRMPSGFEAGALFRARHHVIAVGRRRARGAVAVVDLLRR